MNFCSLVKCCGFSLLIFFEEQIGVIGWNLHKAHLLNPLVILQVPLISSVPLDIRVGYTEPAAVI